MVGEILKKRREESGRDLREISETLKIKYAYLKALEDNDLQSLPAEVYVKAYLVSYARALNLNTEEILAVYNQQVNPPQPEKKSVQNLSSPPPQKRTYLTYLLAPILILCLVIVFASIQRKKAPQPHPPTVIPPKTAQQNAPVESQPVPEQTLEIMANDPTWLQIVSDKNHSQELMMHPGESVTLHARDGFSLKVGNAGGIRVLFNGKDVGKLGEKGEVIKLNLPENSA